MLKTKKVSDHDVVVDKTANVQIPAKGGDWFDIAYSNILALAKKNTGKTTVIKNILKRCAGKHTKFIFIVSTIEKDPLYRQIVDYWEDQGNEVITFDDINEDGENVFKSFMETNKAAEQAKEIVESKAEQSGGSAPKILVSGYGAQQTAERKAEQEVKKAPKKRQPKLLAPDFIIVCDDLGESMRNKDLTQLLKTNRHYKCKIILAAQNITDLLPAAIRQLDYVLAFGRIPLEKIEKLRGDLMLTLSNDDFKELYENATGDPHQFLYIGRTKKGDEFRKGFTQQYMIE